MGMSERRRVAILGGGAGSLAAAFELTATPELRERYDVTVYQLGWRLGGKGASGRREIAGAQRIEEHGLHVWFGFYENAFDVIRRVYEELDRPADAPLRTWRDAFHPTNEVVLCDDTEDDRWIPRHFHFPDNDGVPGIASEPPGLHRLMRDAIRTLRLVEPPEHASLRLKALDKFLDGFLLGLEKLLGGDDGDSELEDLFEALPALRAVRCCTSTAIRPRHGEPLICRFLRLLTDVVWKITDGGRYAMTFDVTATVFRGILTDHLDDRDKGGFAQVNGEEFMAWMARHGARPETLAQSPILRAFYQLCFAYRDGDRDAAVPGRGQGAAGDAAHVPGLPRRDHVEDAGGDGRRHLRADVRGAARPRRALRVLQRDHRHRRLGRRPAGRPHRRAPPGADGRRCRVPPARARRRRADELAGSSPSTTSSSAARPRWATSPSRRARAARTRPSTC